MCIVKKRAALIPSYRVHDDLRPDRKKDHERGFHLRDSLHDGDPVYSAFSVSEYVRGVYPIAASPVFVRAVPSHHFCTIRSSHQYAALPACMRTANGRSQLPERDH